MTNLLIALSNLVNNPLQDIVSHYRFSNRANNMGDALEFYVKDLFCGSTGIKSATKKNQIYSKFFSYLGNQNNPPDIMIRGGDALEVKKIQSLKSGIALNSSYPKDKLYSDSPMITQACRDCESWREKDLIYIIGAAKNNKLRSLWFVYGACYAAERNIYERIKNRISSGFDELEGVELSETKELGRVNKVDPLGITDLRIRGMWHIKNPIKVFDYITGVDSKDGLSVNALILEEKYLSFPEDDRKNLDSLSSKGLTITNVEIKSPNNPAKLLKAKLIKFAK